MAKMKAQVKALQECYDYCENVIEKQGRLKRKEVENLSLKVELCRNLVISIQKIPIGSKKRKSLLEQLCSLEEQCVTELHKNYPHLLTNSQRTKLAPRLG